MRYASKFFFFFFLFWSAFRYLCCFSIISWKSSFFLCCAAFVHGDRGWALEFVPLISLSILVPLSCCLGSCKLYDKLWSLVVLVFWLFFIFTTIMAILGLLHFHLTFRITSSASTWKACWDFDGDWLHWIYKSLLQRTDSGNDFSGSEHGIVLHLFKVCSDFTQHLVQFSVYRSDTFFWSDLSLGIWYLGIKRSPFLTLTAGIWSTIDILYFYWHIDLVSCGPVKLNDGCLHLN